MAQLVSAMAGDLLAERVELQRGVGGSKREAVEAKVEQGEERLAENASALTSVEGCDLPAFLQSNGLRKVP